MVYILFLYRYPKDISGRMTNVLSSEYNVLRVTLNTKYYTKLQLLT